MRIHNDIRSMHGTRLMRTGDDAVVPPGGHFSSLANGTYTRLSAVTLSCKMSILWLRISGWVLLTDVWAPKSLHEMWSLRSNETSNIWDIQNTIPNSLSLVVLMMLEFSEVFHQSLNRYGLSFADRRLIIFWDNHKITQQ